MAEQTGMEIRVQTNTLITAAADVEQKIKDLGNIFGAIEQRVRGSADYWEGSGAGNHLRAYLGKVEMIRTALARFKENADDLKKIAGVYEEAEHKIATRNQVLPTDLLD